MDHTPPDSSVHGILQARIVEWVAMSSSRGSSWPRHRICISGTSRRTLYPEPPGKPMSLQMYLFWMLHTDGIIQYVTFCVWLLSRGIMFSRFIWITVSLPYSVVWVSQSSSAGGLFACFYLVVIVDAIDTRVLVFLCPDVFRILFLIPLGMQRL